MRLKKTIGIILAVILIFQSCAFSVFAGSDYELKNGIFDKKYVYTAIGDSTAVGFHPEFVTDNKYNFDDLSYYINGAEYTSYPKVLSNKIGYKLNNLGICGLTSQGLANILSSKDYVLSAEKGDASALFGENVFPNKGNRYYNAIAAADFITINIGSNDLLQTSLFGEFMSLVTPLMDMTSGEFSLDADFVKEFISFMIKSYSDDAFKEIVDSYKDNYDVIFKKVRTLNPDAQIALVGCYNALSKENLVQRIKDAINDGTIWARLGGDMGAFVTLMKQMISMAPKEEQSALTSELEKTTSSLKTTATTDSTDSEAMDTLMNDLIYVFVVAIVGDRSGDFIDEINEVAKGYANNDDVVYVDVSGCTVPINAMDMHPDDNGHQYIADQIYNAVEGKIKTNNGNSIIGFISNLWKSIINRNFKISTIFTFLGNNFD